jgi:hypothetical protein
MLATSRGAAHPPTNPANLRQRINPARNPTVAWLALEIVLGLAAFGLLIWWTLPRRKRDDTHRPPRR